MGTALERFGGHLDAELNIVRDGVAAARFEAAEASIAANSAKQLATAATARMEQADLTVRARDTDLAALTSRIRELEKQMRQGPPSSSSSESPSVTYESR